MDTNKYAAEQLKKLREYHGLTQLELSEQLNIKQQQIARYENNRRVFKHSFLCQLSEFFQVPIDYFFPTNGETNYPIPELKIGTGEKQQQKKYGEVLKKLGLLNNNGEIDEIQLKKLTQMIDFYKKMNAMQ